MIYLSEHIIDHGFIKEITSTGEKILNAKEIYNIINTQTLSLINSDIRFSKIGVNVGIEFNLEDGKIILNLFAMLVLTS